MKSECPFCQLTTDLEAPSILATYRHCFVVKDRYPVTEGHLLIISKKHYAHWFVAPRTVQNDMIKAANEMQEWLEENYQPDGYNVGINCQAAAGETIPHLHLHLIPRYHGDSEDPRGGVRGVIPRHQKEGHEKPLRPKRDPIC